MNTGRIIIFRKITSRQNWRWKTTGWRKQNNEGLAFRGRSDALVWRMSKKSGKIAALIEQFCGQELDAHYLGYFECFNRQLYYEAHDVLEELWLPDRKGANGDFYKGLIQFAGAFVHLQKERLKPAEALFRLAEANLRKYPARHESLDIPGVLRVIETWSEALKTGDFQKNPMLSTPLPVVRPAS